MPITGTFQIILFESWLPYCTIPKATMDLAAVSYRYFRGGGGGGGGDVHGPIQLKSFIAS